MPRQFNQDGKLISTKRQKTHDFCRQFAGRAVVGGKLMRCAVPVKGFARGQYLLDFPRDPLRSKGGALRPGCGVEGQSVPDGVGGCGQPNDRATGFKVGPRVFPQDRAAAGRQNGVAMGEEFDDRCPFVLAKRGFSGRLKDRANTRAGGQFYVLIGINRFPMENMGQFPGDRRFATAAIANQRDEVEWVTGRLVLDTGGVQSSTFTTEIPFRSVARRVSRDAS